MKCFVTLKFPILNLRNVYIKKLFGYCPPLAFYKKRKKDFQFEFFLPAGIFLPVIPSYF